MNRSEFVQTAVAQTIGEYLRKFCAPHPVETAHARCVEDAEKLADRIYGVVDVSNETNVLPGRKRIKALLGQ